MANILVISAHPDDEVLGMGGTLLKHQKRSDRLFWLIITRMHERQGFSEDQISQRENEITEVEQALSIEHTFRLDYPTKELTPALGNKMIPEISGVLENCRPDILYMINRSDIHSDHRYTFNAVTASAKTFRKPFIKRMLMYECISETEFAPALHENVFIPNYFVDISEFIGQKMKLLSIYQSELNTPPFPRSSENVKALARFRGSMAGTDYAEAFQLLKEVVY